MKTNAKTNQINQRKIIKTMVFLLYILLNVKANSTGINPPEKIKINQITTCQNILKHGEKGIYIYVDFNITNSKMENCNVVANLKHEGKLSLEDTAINTIKSNFEFRPFYDQAHYSSFRLFIPYKDILKQNEMYLVFVEFYIEDTLEKISYEYPVYVKSSN